MKKILFAVSLLASMAAVADADLLNRPGGIKIGERMTLRPYVSISCTFDSNPNSDRDGDKDLYWTANPGINLTYMGGNWNINGTVYYQYHAYTSGRSSSLNNSSFGEQLGISWSKSAGDGSSWGFTISESYSRVDQADDFSNYDGKGLWRNRDQLTASAALQRRFNDRWHASINGSCYMLDYENDITEFAPLFGWNRWSAGAQIGCTVSQWADLFVSGNYSSYSQENSGGAYTGDSDRSNGCTVHVGFGSHLTERITYRISGGWSRFEYAESEVSNGFTYQGSLNWRFAETWSTSLLFSSNYHPSEREEDTSTRSDNLSWGLTKSLVRNKLNATFDLAYRHDNTEYTSSTESDYYLNVLTFRLGLNYSINRFISVFANGEFQTELNGGEETRRSYDSERWRVALGLRFQY